MNIKHEIAFNYIILHEILSWLQTLSPTSLHSCILVNTRWCSIAIRFLWYDLTLFIHKNTRVFNHYNLLMRTLLQQIEPEKLHEVGSKFSIPEHKCWLLPYSTYIKSFHNHSFNTCVVEWMNRNVKAEIRSKMEWDECCIEIIGAIQHLFVTTSTFFYSAEIATYYWDKVRFNHMITVWFELMGKHARPLFLRVQRFRLTISYQIEDDYLKSLVEKICVVCSGLQELTFETTTVDRYFKVLLKFIALKNDWKVVRIRGEMSETDLQRLLYVLGRQYNVTHGSTVNRFYPWNTDALVTVQRINDSV